MAPMDEQAPEYVAMQQQFQRDINRLYDAADRNTRKRGLTKLIEELPWEDKKKAQRSAVRLLIANLVVSPTLALITDPTEKIRELALKLLNLCIKELKLKEDVVSTMVSALCARIGGGSGLTDQSGFAEPSEELRLAVVQTLSAVLCKYREREQEEPVVLPSAMADLLLGTFTRVLQDAFPALKREGADLLCALCSCPAPFTAPMIPAASVRLQYKPLLTKALVPNLTHQHNKVRSVTLRAAARVAAALDIAAEDLETVVAETVGPLLARSTLNDKNPSVRRELCSFVSTVLTAFYSSNASSHAGMMGLDAEGAAAGANKLLVGNATLVVLLLILCGDESPEVASAAHEHLLAVARAWARTPVPLVSGGAKMMIDGVDEDNAELVVRAGTGVGAAAAEGSGVSVEGDGVSDELAVANFLCNYRGAGASDLCTTWFPRWFRTVAAVVLDGVNGWTMTSRMQYTRGLHQLFARTIVAPADLEARCEYQRLAAVLLSSAAPAETGRATSYVAEAPNKFAAGLLAYDIATTLGVALRSDEPELRVVAQACGEALGQACGRQHTTAEARSVVAVFSELLIPLIAGAVPGGDTASQRCNAIRTATYLLQGFATSGADVTSVSEELVAAVLVPLSSVELYAFRETYVSESVLLLLRMVIAHYPRVCTERIATKERVLMCFVCLLGVHSSGGPVRPAPTLPQDDNRSLGSINTSSMHYNTTSTGAGVSVIYEASYKELLRYCGLCTGGAKPVDLAAGSGDAANIAAVEAVMSPFYAFFLGCLVRAGHVPELSVSQTRGEPRLLSSEQKLGALGRICSPSTRTESGELAMDAFMFHPHLKNAFESLVRVAPGLAWSYHSTLVPIIILHTEPPAAPDPIPPAPPGATLEEREALKPKETPEQVMRGYAACRGEDLASEVAQRARDETHLQTRLDLIGLLEDMLRFGSLNWECSAHINGAAEDILTRILLPNLVWKAGRVESATRKLALAATYALLKAGSVKVEILFKHAGTLTPAIVSHLDDYYDVVPRQISCYCLAIVFERLRGAFSESAVSNLYPQLLKRLDDSSDVVRTAVGHTLEMFMQAGPRNVYSNTMLGYTLDQLFIHLDDMNPAVQQAMFKVIMQCAELDKPLVVRKATDAQCTHRTPTNCKKIISMCELGYEVL